MKRILSLALCTALVGAVCAPAVSADSAKPRIAVAAVNARLIDTSTGEPVIQQLTASLKSADL